MRGNIKLGDRNERIVQKPFISIDEKSSVLFLGMLLIEFSW